jgi:hypothetical protein
MGNYSYEVTWVWRQQDLLERVYSLAEGDLEEKYGIPEQPFISPRHTGKVWDYEVEEA